MKLRTKILILTIAAFLLGGYSIAATGIVKVTEMADTSARTQMSLLVTNFANEIDDSLGRFSTTLSANVFPTESDLSIVCDLIPTAKAIQKYLKASYREDRRHHGLHRQRPRRSPPRRFRRFRRQRHLGHLQKGEILRNVDNANIVPELIKEIEKL